MCGEEYDPFHGRNGSYDTYDYDAPVLTAFERDTRVREPRARFPGRSEVDWDPPDRDDIPRTTATRRRLDFFPSMESLRSGTRQGSISYSPYNRDRSPERRGSSRYGDDEYVDPYSSSSRRSSSPHPGSSRYRDRYGSGYRDSDDDLYSDSRRTSSSRYRDPSPPRYRESSSSRHRDYDIPTTRSTSRRRDFFPDMPDGPSTSYRTEELTPRRSSSSRRNATYSGLDDYEPRRSSSRRHGSSSSYRRPSGW